MSLRPPPNYFPTYVDILSPSIPAAPPTGRSRLFRDPTDGQLKVIHSSGTISSIEDIPLQQQFLVKPADESIDCSLAANLQNDDDMFFPILASEVWYITVSLRINFAAANNFKLSFTGPSGVPYMGYQGAYGQSGTTTLGNPTSTNTTNGTEQGLLLRGWWVNGVTGGTVRLQWSHAAVAAGTGNVRFGSFMQALRLV